MIIQGFYFLRESGNRNSEKAHNRYEQAYGVQLPIYLAHNGWSWPNSPLWTAMYPLWWGPSYTCMGETSVWQTTAAKTAMASIGQHEEEGGMLKTSMY